jgi:mono/diheme cytochrome c family protein
MNRKLRMFLFTILMMIFVSSIAAPEILAGGWAMVTLDTLPVQPRTGEAITLGFMVRQHGVTPVSEPLSPYLSAQNRDTGDLLRVDARQEGRVGHYVAEVVFPSAGAWDWKVVPDPFPAIPERLEPLIVLPAPATVAGSHCEARDRLPVIARWLPVVAAMSVAGLGLYLSRSGPRRKVGVAVGIIFLVALSIAFLLWPSAIPDVTGSSQDFTQDAGYGRALFSAKGCVACHMYSTISNSIPGPILGPNLTGYRPEPDFTRRWLRDPRAVRPDAQMPNLDLSDAEIEALIVFLSEGTGG